MELGDGLRRLAFSIAGYRLRGEGAPPDRRSCKQEPIFREHAPCPFQYGRFFWFSSVEFSVQNKASVWRAWSTTESIRTSPRETPSAELADTCERNKACAKRDFNTYEGALRPTLSMQSHDARAPGSQLSCRPPPARTFLNSSCRPLSPRASGGLTGVAPLIALWHAHFPPFVQTPMSAPP